MGAKGNISQYRERLDKTLSSHDLANEEELKNLVRGRIVHSLQDEIQYVDNIVERRTKEVWNFLAMLRSASVKDDQTSTCSEAQPGGWKVKQDTEEIRVMYREGPEGTPFHTLLAEGYVDGPTDICLCISWESTLYQKWWPKIVIPTFKILSSKCLQKIRSGEQISLVRMKLPWPLSEREILVHFFALEYFQDDLIVVLLNSIPELESIDKSSHGFSKDGIPDAQDVVRVDVVGGFALQKVTADRSYFRTIANLDIKLDFVPPPLINFISRQLICSGFKLYKKEVASVSNGDEEFHKALKDPLYAQIREALYSDNTLSAMEPEARKADMFILPAEHQTETTEAEEIEMDKTVSRDDDATHSYMEDSMALNQKALDEIEEIEDAMASDNIVLDEIEEIKEEVGNAGFFEEDNNKLNNLSNDQIAEKYGIRNKKNVAISSEVQQALETLEKIISIYREYRFNPEARIVHGISSERSLNIEKDTTKCSKSSEDHQVCLNVGEHLALSDNKSTKKTSQEPRSSCSSHNSRRTGSSSYFREANHNRIAPASPDAETLNLSENQQTSICSAENMKKEITIVEKISNEDKLVLSDINGKTENQLAKKNKKVRSRYFHKFLCS